VDTGQLIKKLKASNLYAECYCGGEFRLSEAILFDGTKPFPEEAMDIQRQLILFPPPKYAFLSFP